MEPPNDFKSALSIAFNVLLHANKEINRTQTFTHFNVFLAPFIKGLEYTKIKQSLKIFSLNLNQHSEATLGLELAMPKALADKKAVCAEGKICGTYGDYAQESLYLVSILMDLFIEESRLKPLLSPKLIINVNSRTLTDENAKEILAKAHQLVAQGGTPYFANLTKKENENTAFSSSGVKFSSDLTGEWETDTLRTGCLGCVTINMPRIVQECEKDKYKFNELMKERFELAARALGIKSNALKQFGKNSLPFLMQKTGGDTYFRLENCSRIVNVAGFREAVEAFTEKTVSSEESRKFIEEVIANLLAFKQKIGRKYGKRLYPSVLSDYEAAERLAQLDIERYGVAKVKFSGTRDKPYYSTLKRIHIKAAQPLVAPTGTVEMAQLTKGLNGGGSLDIYELEGTELKAETLLDLTQRIIESGASEFFTYNRIVSYCGNCKKNWVGTLHKCPSCGSMSTITTFDRFTST
jgi:ribonucleoside-triphosphate reductase